MCRWADVSGGLHDENTSGFPRSRERRGENRIEQYSEQAGALSQRKTVSFLFGLQSGNEKENICNSPLCPEYTQPSFPRTRESASEFSSWAFSLLIEISIKNVV